MAGKIFDEIILLGDNAAWYEKGILQSPIEKDKVHIYSTIDKLVAEVEKYVLAGDFLFIKGSQAKNHLEKVVKLFMKDPEIIKDWLTKAGHDLDSARVISDQIP